MQQILQFSHEWFSRCWWVKNLYASVRVAEFPNPENGHHKDANTLWRTQKVRIENS